MVRAEVRGFHSPDAGDVRTFFPPDPANVGLMLQVFVGPVGQDGSESFDVQVCTPRWLEARLDPSDVQPGLHMLIVARWDWRSIETHVRRGVAAARGDSWSDLADKLDRSLGRWEFSP